MKIIFPENVKNELTTARGVRVLVNGQEILGVRRLEFLFDADAATGVRIDLYPMDGLQIEYATEPKAARLENLQWELMRNE
jgi:hypothetical protein